MSSVQHQTKPNHQHQHHQTQPRCTCTHFVTHTGLRKAARTRRDGHNKATQQPRPPVWIHSVFVMMYRTVLYFDRACILLRCHLTLLLQQSSMNVLPYATIPFHLLVSFNTIMPDEGQQELCCCKTLCRLMLTTTWIKHACTTLSCCCCAHAATCAVRSHSHTMYHTVVSLRVITAWQLSAQLIVSYLGLNHQALA
jgi:hypothetical protein